MPSYPIKMRSFYLARLGRAVVGACAGAILGLALEVVGFWDGPPESGERFLPIIGFSTGGILELLYGYTVGGTRLLGTTKHVAIGALVGVISGVLIGALPFAAIMTMIDFYAYNRGGGKAFSMFQFIGIFLGLLIGGVLGSLTAFIYDARQRKDQTSAN